jgi:UTP--glucose-1-phosphate uridylyltransferase
LPDELLIGVPGAIAELAAVHERTRGNAISVVEVAAGMTHRYGIVDPGAPDPQGAVEVRGMVEKPRPEEAPSRLAIVGRYVLTPEIFELLERGERGAGNEIQLTDAMAGLIGVSPFHAMTFRGRRFDCGQPGGFLEANVALALARPDLGPALRRDLGRLLKED